MGDFISAQKMSMCRMGFPIVVAYFYQKSCNSHDEQCREIFGKDARSASQSCYKEINTQGNRFGQRLYQHLSAALSAPNQLRDQRLLNRLISTCQPLYQHLS